MSLDASAVVDTDAATSYEWTLGDGTTLPGDSPTHTYESPGVYTVELTATMDDGRTETYDRVLTIGEGEAPPSTATFDVSPSLPTPGEEITVDAGRATDPDGEITSYEWTFGDDTTATGETATHSYESTGEYDVTLTVTDNDGTTTEQTHTVTVRPPSDETVEVGPGGEHTFSPSDLIIEPNTTVAFIWKAGGHTVTVDSTPDGAGWEGQSSTKNTNYVHVHTFETPGTYEYHCQNHPNHMQGTITMATDTELAQVQNAIDEDADGKVDRNEMGKAIGYWKNGEEVPGAGQPVDQQTLLELIDNWHKRGGR